MREKHCGGCDHQGEISQNMRECLIDGELHDNSYVCEDFKFHIPGKTAEARRKEAEGIRNSKEAQKDRNHAKELQDRRMLFDRKFWEANWWWQLILVFISGLIGWLLNSAFTN